MTKTPINVVINTISEDVLRWGKGVDFQNDGAFNSGTETYITNATTDGDGNIYTNDISNPIKSHWTGVNSVFENIANPDYV